MKIFQWLSLVLIAVMVWTVFGCASQTKGNSQTAESGVAPAPTQASEQASAGEKPADKLSAEEEALFEDDWGTTEDSEPQEMYQVFHEVPEALKNTLEITEKCHVGRN